VVYLIHSRIYIQAESPDLKQKRLRRKSISYTRKTKAWTRQN
jgi:hypothetical protein